MKTNKSYTKRIRVTRNGVLIARKPGQDHFNAKERGRTKGLKGRANTQGIGKSLVLPILLHARACTHCAGHDGSDSSFPGGLGSWRSCFG